MKYNVDKNRRYLLQSVATAPLLFCLPRVQAKPPQLKNLSINIAMTDEIRASLISLFGNDQVKLNEKVDLDVPVIGENKEVLQVSVRVDIDEIEAVAIYVPKNLPPLSGLFYSIDGPNRIFSTRVRVRMSSSDILAVVVTRNGELYGATKRTHFPTCDGGGG